jgi:transposase
MTNETTIAVTPDVDLVGRAKKGDLDAFEALILPAETYQLIQKLLRTLQWLMSAIEAKDTTIGRLARMIFGAKTEKTKQLFPKPPPATAPGQTTQSAAPKRKGHGRTAAADYTGAQRVPVTHPQLRPGEACPDCKQGKLYVLKRPAQWVRITAQPLFAATRFELEQLRCKLCGKVFTAPAPPEAGLEKYDPNTGPMLGYMRFGTGLPHYRLERMQADLGVRLPASTQWELMAQTGQALEPVHQTLMSLAAQGHLIHNDDTPMRVQSLAEEAAPAAQGKERTGVFTTGLISPVEGNHTIALFITGHRHAGENLDQLLARRATGCPPPIQMCDALSRNPSKEFQIILANCLSHGRRQFVDIAQDFPQPCQQVLESLGEVYKYDAQAKELGLSPEARLQFHQEHSREIMDQLRDWINQCLEQKLVEPNSGLGDAFQYLLRHWDPLTLFLRQAGAPLDNNINYAARGIIDSIVVLPMVEAGDEDGSVRQVHHCAGAEGSDDLAGAKLGRGHGFCVQSFKFLTPRSTLGSTSRIERLARNFRRTGGRFGKSGWRNG